MSNIFRINHYWSHIRPTFYFAFFSSSNICTLKIVFLNHKFQIWDLFSFSPHLFCYSDFSPSLTHCTCSLSLSLSLSLSFTHKNAISISLSHSHTHTHTHTLTHTQNHIHTLLFFSLSLSHTHTYTHV
jgi:hypothetical protein